MILDTGATANLVCFRWLRRHNAILQAKGSDPVTTYPAQATFRFGDGGTGEVSHAADIPVGAAGVKGEFTAFVSESDIEKHIHVRQMRVFYRISDLYFVAAESEVGLERVRIFWFLHLRWLVTVCFSTK